MESSLGLGLREEKKKRKRRRRRIRRGIFLLGLLAFLLLTEAGNHLIYRASEIEASEVLEFSKRVGRGILELLPSTRDWLADKLTYMANFL